MSDARAEALAVLSRLAREEVEEFRAQIALIERAVLRAMAGTPPPGDDALWAEALADAETAAESARARSARIAALIAGRAA